MLHILPVNHTRIYDETAGAAPEFTYRAQLSSVQATRDQRTLSEGYLTLEPYRLEWTFTKSHPHRKQLASPCQASTCPGQSERECLGTMFHEIYYLSERDSIANMNHICCSHSLEFEANVGKDEHIITLAVYNILARIDASYQHIDQLIIIDIPTPITMQLPITLRNESGARELIRRLFSHEKRIFFYPLIHLPHIYYRQDDTCHVLMYAN